MNPNPKYWSHFNQDLTDYAQQATINALVRFNQAERRRKQRNELIISAIWGIIALELLALAICLTKYYEAIS